MDDKQTKNPFQQTLNLPQTEFSIRANAQIKEPEIIARWEREKLASEAMKKNKGRKKFILHDGPPYANGHLHIGHALTYILKDAVCKYKRMSGYHAPLIPGWDCHGLPIELKVTAELGLEKGLGGVDRVVFKKYCREYARKWIEIQSGELKELGKLADYEKPYVTMSPDYEASIIRALGRFVERGHIERKLKTVPWCFSCRTVLATAEIEYKDRKDPSVYVLFRLPDETARLTFPFLFEKNPNLVISLAVWTTTPWTLPLNRAVVLNPDAVYSVLQGRTENEAFVVAQNLADKVCATVGLEKKEIAECDAVVLDGKHVMHPFIDNQLTPVLLDEMVQVSDGTACLHSAPGCGPEDYLFGVKRGLEIFSPLSDDGRYTFGIKPAELEGTVITDGQIWVLRKLVECNTLLFKNNISHSYPHCWRCRNGLMFRATHQWFCNLQKNDLIEKSLAEIEKIAFIPERGQARLHSFIGNRTEWCISRQRQWGVPIPAVTCTRCGWSHITAAFVNAVADHVSKEGIEFWDRMDVAQLKALGLLDNSFACQSCPNTNEKEFALERDILDVWFDSGVSSYAVLAQDKENLGVPADLYFEGSDQHRGWFQSSLLCGMVLYDHAPMKGIATHGFVVDEQKRKMSKSVGNVVAPADVMAKYSRDILRLWVATSDFQDDLVISEKLLGNVAEMYRKIRNTCRFLIANTVDFDQAVDALPLSDLWPLDRYALDTFRQLKQVVFDGYDQYNFAQATHAINNYCATTLSAVYLDILKDRLYVEQPKSVARRSAQTVLSIMLDDLTKMIAPILSFLAEELSDAYQKDKKHSIHLQDMPERDYAPLVDREAWADLEQLRGAVLKAIEVKREAGVVKHPYEAAVVLYIDHASDQGKRIAQLFKQLPAGADASRLLRDWFIVSDVVYAPDQQDLQQADGVSWCALRVDRAAGIKCPRCWQWTQASHEQGLCNRCVSVLAR